MDQVVPIATQLPFSEGGTMHRVEIVRVTPDMAREWISSRPYQGQRSLRPWWVQYLAEEMRRGRFRPTAEVVFSVENGDRYRTINGNHTLHAIVQCGIPQTVTVFHYASEGGADTAEAYGAIDIGLGRNTSDLYSALSIKEELGFTSAQLNRLGGGVKLIHLKFANTYGRLHPDDHLRMIRQYSPAAHNYFDLAAGCPQSISAAAFRSSTMAVALVTYRFATQVFDKERVFDFWKGAIFDDGVKSGDPRKAANRHLELTGTVGGGHKKSGRGVTVVSQAYSARYLANCFNAWMEKRSITVTRVDDATAPIRIVGTPFTGTAQ